MTLKKFWKNLWKAMSQIGIFPKENPRPFAETEKILSVTDEDTIRKDWEAVGKDLESAMDKQERIKNDNENI